MHLKTSKQECVSAWQELNCTQFHDVSLVLRTGRAPGDDGAVESFPLSSHPGSCCPWQLPRVLLVLGTKSSLASDAFLGGDLNRKELGNLALLM